MGCGHHFCCFLPHIRGGFVPEKIGWHHSEHVALMLSILNMIKPPLFQGSPPVALPSVQLNLAQIVIYSYQIINQLTYVSFPEVNCRWSTLPPQQGSFHGTQLVEAQRTFGRQHLAICITKAEAGRERGWGSIGEIIANIPFFVYIEQQI